MHSALIKSMRRAKIHYSVKSITYDLWRFLKCPIGYFLLTMVHFYHKVYYRTEKECRIKGPGFDRALEGFANCEIFRGSMQNDKANGL